MKKQYLLASIAALFFCAASVNAQNIQPKLEGTSTPNVFQVPTLQTRAETQTARPDSAVVEEYGDVVSKEVYKYDDAGRKTEQVDYENTPLVPKFKHLYEYDENGKLSKINTTYWNGTQWILFCVENYAYDGQGRQTRYDYDRIAIEGVFEKRHVVYLTKYEGNKVITALEDTTWHKEPNVHYETHKNTLIQILDDRGNIISEEYFDNIYGYAPLKQEMTYDENNRMLKKFSVYYNADGSVDVKYRDTFTYGGQYEYQLMEISEGGEDNWQFALGTGLKIIEGNPKIIVCYDRANGEDTPMTEWKSTSYYYPN